MKSKNKSLTVLAVIVLLLALPITISAATPPQPTYTSATIDGNPGEWILATDFFANMYRAADPGKQIESKVYLRYACPVGGTSGILYALVLAQPRVTLDGTGDQFIKLGNADKRVDQNSGDNGTAPDFAWITSGSDKIGWEASALFNPGVYTNLNIHAQVLDGGSQTSAVIGRAIDLTLTCGNIPTAVSLSGLSATNAGSSFPALPVLGVGMTALAAMVVVRRPRK
jgi:hypothetical protein